MVLAEGDKPRSLAYLAVKAVICHITTLPCMSRKSSSGTEEDLFHGLFLLLFTEEEPSLLDYPLPPPPRPLLIPAAAFGLVAVTAPC